MPQIGWFEILIVVGIAIVVIGPKDFPIVLKKIGGWMGKIRGYFSEIQKDVSNITDTVEEEISVEKNEGMVTSTGSLSVKTGKYTGRSPDDRFIVFDDLTHDKVHWGKVNKQFPTETFEKLSQKMKKCLLNLRCRPV